MKSTLRRALHRLVLLFALCAVFSTLAATSTTTAEAQPANAKARTLFEKGSQAYREARYEQAIDLFRQAYELDPHPELVYNVGQAYEKLGDVSNALRSFREYLRQAPSASDKTSVEDRIKNLERRLSERGVQQVSVYSAPSGARVVLDGKQVGKTPWTGEIQPGRHTAVLKLAGYTDVTKEFLLTSTRAVDVEVTFSVPAASPAAAAPATTVGEPVKTSPVPAEPPPETEKKRSVAPWTWAALGVGVAALGGALAFELSRKSAEDDARDAPSQIEHQEHYATMEDRQGTARLLLGVGAVATVAGGVLLYFDLKGGKSEQTGSPARLPSTTARGSLRVGVGCSAARCGALATGSF
jgi:tetratricopeptide (TPR) repeat protein